MTLTFPKLWELHCWLQASVTSNSHLFAARAARYTRVLLDPQVFDWDWLVAQGFEPINGAPDGPLLCWLDEQRSLEMWPEFIDHRLGAARWSYHPQRDTYYQTQLFLRPKTRGQVRQLWLQLKGAV